MKEIDQNKLDEQSKGFLSNLANLSGSPMQGVCKAAVMGVIGAATLTAAAAGIDQVVDVKQAMHSPSPVEKVHMHAESLAGQSLDAELAEQIQQAAESSEIDVTISGDNHLEVSVPVEMIGGEMAVPSDLQATLVEVTQQLDGQSQAMIALEGHNDVAGAGTYITDHQIAEVEQFMERVAASQDMELGVMVPVSYGSSEIGWSDEAQGPSVDLQVLSGDAAQQYLDEVEASRMSGASLSM